jgi:nucleoside-diphosphate-sugar epimerase
MILVTGDSGFIGQHLIRRLLARGERVKGIDIRPKPETSPDYPQVVGNVLDPAAVKESLIGVRCIIHLAAEHKDFGITRDKYFEVNEGGTRHLLERASEAQVREFVFYSSVAVYGAQDSPNEKSNPQPINPYGESKLAGEGVVRSWAQEDATRKAVIIRPTVVFGPHSRANIFKLISYVCDRKFIWVGNGEHIKSIAFVENLVEATLFVLDHLRPGLEVFNYSDEPQLTTRELVSLIAETAGVRQPRLKIPLPLALRVATVFDMIGAVTGIDLPVTTARIKKFNTPTIYRSDPIRSRGFTAPFSISEGLDRSIRWYFDERKSGKVLEFESSRD